MGGYPLAGDGSWFWGPGGLVVGAHLLFPQMDGWDDVDLHGWLVDLIEASFAVENDSNLAVLSEAQHGARRVIVVEDAHYR